MNENIKLTQFINHLKAMQTVLTEKYHVASLGIFGSYIRHEQKPNSDLDILVTFSKTPCLITFVELQCDLSDWLEVDVDLVLKDGLKPAIAEYILMEAIPIL
ncbi:MAG: hypothetical protein B6242_05765 [Anaerolineaceae bacterium 4572_78]|nr:MAG: hypothetical protein B6242_05765 [Anaerolineaceae bacterium 4572_78]